MESNGEIQEQGREKIPMIWNSTGFSDNLEDRRHSNWCEEWKNYLIGVLSGPNFNNVKVEYPRFGNCCMHLEFAAGHKSIVQGLMESIGFKLTTGEHSEEVFYMRITGSPPKIVTPIELDSLS